MKILGSLAVALALLGAGCGDGPVETAATQGVTVYKLAPDDRVKVVVYGEDDLSGEYLVGSDGNVSFPLIGSVKAGGLSLAQFRAELASSLHGRYLKDPRVSADIVAYRPFFILGEVNHPGQYPYRVGLTLNAAVATAGGYTYRANQKVVAVQHLGAPGEERFRVTSSLQVSAGDTVRVLERFF